MSIRFYALSGLSRLVLCLGSLIFPNPEGWHVYRNECCVTKVRPRPGSNVCFSLVSL